MTQSKYDAMIASGAGDVPVVGGPLDGATRPFSSCHQMCVAFIRPDSIRHEWYEQRTWARLVGGKQEYKHRWVYLGTGSQNGPPVTKPMPIDPSSRGSVT